MSRTFNQTTHGNGLMIGSFGGKNVQNSLSSGASPTPTPFRFPGISTMYIFQCGLYIIHVVFRDLIIHRGSEVSSKYLLYVYYFIMLYLDYSNWFLEVEKSSEQSREKFGSPQSQLTESLPGNN